MDRKRILEKNQIKDNIKLLESYIEVDKRAISRFKAQPRSTEYISAQILKLEGKNDCREQEINDLFDRIQKIENCDMDDEINLLYVNDSKEIELKNIETKKKKDKEKLENKVNSEISQEYYQQGRKSDKSERYNKKDADRAQKYFTRTCNGIPDYMIKKLKNMPNNRGYIWRDVYCYGEQPPEKGRPTLMFEKKGSVHITHEWTPTSYKIWHSKDKGKKKLYYSVQRCRT